MASARRILPYVSSAVRRAAGVDQWSRREYVSTAMVKQWPSSCPSIQNRHLSSNTSSTDYNYFREIGYTDVVDLLSAPERDFLLTNDGQKVPVSSLRGKLVGLYLCERKPLPPPHCDHMEVIKKVYEEAKLRGYDFEIVQITFDFDAKHPSTNPIVHHFCEDVIWLTLPSKDPGFKKILRIFDCDDEEHEYWGGDSLVLIHPPEAEAEADDRSGVLFEFAGTKILKQWGIEGYPFTRQSLYKVEYELQKREVTLQSFFPPGECLLRRPRSDGNGFDLVDASQLSGKRVLVLVAPHSTSMYIFGLKFLRMLKSMYRAQLEDNVPEESRFEVVYVSTERDVSSFDVLTKDMPWLVHPLPSRLNNHEGVLLKVFKPCPKGSVGVAFNEQGELIAKEDFINKEKQGRKLQFPFIDQDLEKLIRLEVEYLCDIGC